MTTAFAFAELPPHLQLTALQELGRVFVRNGGLPSRAHLEEAGFTDLNDLVQRGWIVKSAAGDFYLPKGEAAEEFRQQREAAL